MKRRLLSGGSRAGSTEMKRIDDPPHLRDQYETSSNPVSEELSFTTNNGARLLSRFFARVELAQYPDELRVTEVEPLLDYLFSSDLLSHPIGNAGAEFGEFLQRLLTESGAIRIRKEVGLFTATEARKEI
jgi:hypothetical protein